MSNVDSLLTRMRYEVPQCRAVWVAKLDDGSLVGQSTEDPNMDLAIPCAMYANALQENAQGLALVGQGGETSEDIVVTIRSAFILVRMVGPRHYEGVIVSNSTVPSTARTFLKRHDAELVAALSS